MDTFADSQAIFEQLAQIPCAGPGGVRAIIENHDAWANAETVHGTLNRVLIARLANTASDVRIHAQRARLGRLAVVLPPRYSSAI